MIIDFRQGIISYDFTTFPFLVSGSGSIVSLVIGTQPVLLTVAQSTNNYTFTEPTTVNNAWTGLNATGQSWLYWDFNTTTLARTFGFTTLQPVAQATAPLTPQTGQMWYNTSTFQNYVYQSGGWTEVLRVFAAEYNGNTSPPYQFISEGDQPPLPSGYANFTGTQIGVNQANVASGFPLFNSNGVPLNQGDGTFLTTESVMFEQGTPITGVRLESNVYTASSSDVTTIPAYGVVAFETTGTIQLGSYNDAGNTAIGMALQNIPSGGSGGVLLEGTITNVQWNWSNYIGQLLWISGDQPGTLTFTDPHLSDPITYPAEQSPVARVLTQDTIIFLQGIGTQGPPGAPGGGSTVVPATPLVAGIVYLSTDGGTFPNPTNTVVADGDPRLTNARLATANSVLAATNITVASYTPSNTYGTNVQLALQALASNTLNLTGGTLTGNLILNSDPTVPFQAATKNYVDNSILALESQTVLISGSTMTGPLILSGDPTVPLQAATKQYVDGVATGITFQAAVAAATTANLNAVYAGSPNYTLTEVGNGALVIDGVSLTTAGPISLIDGLGVITGGSGYVTGSYDNVPFTGGSGTGATAFIVVSGGGSITSVTVTTPGNNYLVGDVLSASNTYLGGTGSGFSVPVISVSSGRVLVKNQSVATQNGIYDVINAGSVSSSWILKRDASELPPNLIVSGTYVFVSQGTQNVSTGWILATQNPITLDVTPLSFVQFSAAASVTSNSITTALGYIPVGPFPVSSGSGISVSGSPINGPAPSGIVLTLSTELVGLSALSSSGFGFVQRTGVGTYVATPITAAQITGALGYIPLATRNINTTLPLVGGGPLTSDLTLSINQFTDSAPGIVPTSPGGTVAFLRADGTWAVPPGGGGGGGVSSVAASTTSTGLTISGTNPITGSGTLVFNLNAELQGLAGLSTDGVVQRTGAGTYIAAPYTTTLTGDITGSGNGSFATTLATVNSNVGTFGNSTNVATITVNGKGLVTAVTTAPISINGILPSQTGNAGDFLTTNGTSVSWASSVTSPAGLTTQIQYNNSGAFGASAALTWNDTSQVLALGSTTTTTTFINTNSNSSGPVNLTIAAGNISIQAGTPTSSGAGRTVSISGGNALTAGLGGGISLLGGTGASSSNGGEIDITGGSATSGNGGNVVLFGGASTSSSGGSVIIQTTPSTSSNYVTRLQITPLGEWIINGVSGLAGQVLTAAGAGSPPSFQFGKNNNVYFATANQTVFNTTVSTTVKTAFPNGTAYIQVFVNGVQQREDNSAGTAFSPNSTGQFYVSGANQITFFTGLSVGDEVTLYQL